MGEIRERGIAVTLIAGIGYDTIRYLQTIPSDSLIEWPDGRVIGAINTQTGDGNAQMESVFALAGDKYVVQATHLDMLYKSEAILRKKLQ